MIESEYRPGFLLETTHPTFVLRQFRRQHLERDFAVMLFRVLAQKNLTHSAFAESLKNAVVSDILW